MSTQKRPGAKDISDLKARLGLKKKGGAKPGGVAAPPGARVGGVIPAPPGVEPPRPNIPDAKDDPFGAMNAMAAHTAQTAHAQPQFVVVNDGTPVEQVQKKNRAKVMVIGGVALLALIMGITMGKISAGANMYNRTIDAAAVVRDDIKQVRDGLIGYQQILTSGKERGKGKFVPNDEKLTQELEAMPPLKPDIEKVLGAFMYDLSPELIAAILSFYVDVIELNEAIKNHVEAAKGHEKVIQEGQVNIQGFNPLQYAGLIKEPSEEEAAAGKPVTVQVVQLGTPICEGETTPSEQGCPGKIGGFRYRTDETGPWGVKKLAEADAGTVTAEALVMLDPSSKALQQLVKGGKATVAEIDYLTRITAIDEMVTGLIERQKAIESRLNNKAIESKKFTFFM